MVPILLNFNQQAHDVELSFADKDLAIYNNLLTGILAANPALTFNMAEFEALLSDPTGYAFDAVVADNPVSIGGAPVSRQVAMSLVQIPDSWNTIINLVKAVNADFAENAVYNRVPGQTVLFNRLSTTNLQITANVFSLTAAYTTALTAKYSIYTTTDNQNSVYAALNDIYTSCLSLKTLGASLTAQITLTQLGITDTLNGSFVFNPTSFVTKN